MEEVSVVRIKQERAVDRDGILNDYDNIAERYSQEGQTFELAVFVDQFAQEAQQSFLESNEDHDYLVHMSLKISLEQVLIEELEVDFFRVVVLLESLQILIEVRRELGDYTIHSVYHFSGNFHNFVLDVVLLSLTVKIEDRPDLSNYIVLLHRRALVI